MIVEKQTVSTPVPMPSRPRGSFNSTFQNYPVLANCFRIKVTQPFVYCYRMDFDPKLSDDDRKRRVQILKDNRKAIAQVVGDNYTLSGMNLYSLSNRTEEAAIELTGKQTLKVRLVRTINLKEHQPEVRMFLSTLFKTFLRSLDGFQQIGKQAKFMDIRNRVEIGNTGLYLRSGFATNVSALESGLFLRVDSINKIDRSTTVLQFIDDFYRSNGSLSKDQKREQLQQQLKGKVIVTSYGNEKYYKIESLIFDQNINSIFIDPDNQHSIYSYFKDKYNIAVLNPKAPLIKPFKKSQRQPDILLIPELCKMTGIPQNCDERLRKQISTETIKPPAFKTQKIKKVMKRVWDLPNGPKQFDSLGIKFDDQFTKVNAKIIPFPELQLGNSNRVDRAKVQFFNLFDKPLFKSDKRMSVVLIHSNMTQKNSIFQIQNVFKSTCNNLRVSMQLKIHRTNYTDSRMLQEIQQVLQGLKSDKAVFIILPNSLKTHYKKIKRISILNKFIVSQVALAATFKRKGVQSIITKILLQINAKIGNVLWSPKLNSNLSKVMMVGINVSKDQSNNKMNVIGLCASINPGINKFFSLVKLQERSSIVITHIFQLVKRFMKAYYESNNSLPDEIVILREGCSQGQLPQIKEFEVNRVIESLDDIAGSLRPKLVYIVVDKKPSLKLFTQRFQNVDAGTLVCSQIVSSDYDFYIVPQRVRMGTATPTYYKVILNQSRHQEGLIQELIYGQCYNYMNWTGCVRVPGVLQYAKKVSQFGGTYLNTDVVQGQVCQHLFYI